MFYTPWRMARRCLRWQTNIYSGRRPSTASARRMSWRCFRAIRALCGSRSHEVANAVDVGGAMAPMRLAPCLLENQMTALRWLLLIALLPFALPLQAADGLVTVPSPLAPRVAME